jgi:hypothetical protein
MKTKSICLAAWLCVVALGSQAQEFDVSPFFGYRFGGGVKTTSGQETDLEAGRAYGLSLGLAPLDLDQKLALFWSGQDSGLDLESASGLGHLKVAVDEFMIGGIYEHGHGRLRETFTALLGATVYSPNYGELEARFSFGVGLGVKYFLFKNLALRADLRGYCTVVESDSAFISSGGVTIVYFSGSAIWQGEISGGITFSF